MNSFMPTPNYLSSTGYCQKSTVRYLSVRAGLSVLADIWANHFANDFDAINSFTFRVNYGTI